MSMLYHPGKANVVADALSILTMVSAAHVENNKRELVREAHWLARLGMREGSLDIELPADLSSVHPVFHVSLLKKYMDDSAVVVPLESTDIQNSLSYEELPIEILDHQTRRLRNKEVPLVKVLRRNQTAEVATWEVEADMSLRAKLEKLHHEVDRLLDENIDDHTDVNNTSMHEDLMDVLLRVQNDGNYELTRNNIKAVILDMFAAGTDTSASTVDWTMAEMLKNPSALEKAQEEVRRVFSEKGYVDESIFDQLKYLRAVIKETLRKLVNVWTIGRYWEDAECFKPERFLDSSIDFNGNNFEYIPFGAGRRMCPGMSFGLANVEHPLALFLYHFDWKLPNRIKHEDLDMSEVYFGVTVRRELNMHVIPIVSKPV
ncbi:hypothetical protein T459_01217 [Capsicum annuum]|uniref:Uncharacterized protein n=1 Tax=Capsicum annuum TaxID=4072 RepID=A0A2G3AGG9_CAPAN|nr:hypothetical protein T459_01217 [Capsicum annuum]